MQGLTLTTREQARIQVLNGVIERKVSMAEAAELMRVSERHAWRLLAAYRKEGAAGVAHGNRGRRPSTATSPETQEQVTALAKGRYAGFNHSHLTELLAEREGVRLSRSTVRRVLLAGGVRSPRRRRARKRYLRRERYPQEGMLLQVDGSRHDWLEGRGPRLTLIGAVDDATGTVPFALFREQEDAHGYLLMLKEIIDRRGVPMALYSDRHSIFQRSPRESESRDEQLRGRRDPTQFARALEELGITLIMAHTPQAKGRVERAWDTFQDRLVSEMRLAGAATIEEANRMLGDFLPRYDRQFAVAPAQREPAYRPLPPGVSLDAVRCFKYLRTVANDHTVHFNGQTLQLLPDGHRAGYARTRVEVQERLDGSIVVVHQGRTVATAPAPAGPVALRARTGRRSNGQLPADSPARPARDGHRAPTTAPRPPAKTPARTPNKPAPNHPWRRALLT